MHLQQSTNCSFVVGCGHSGTSLLLRLLGEHSSIYAIPGESNLFILRDRYEIVKQLEEFDKLAQEAGKDMWVEKTPKHVHRLADILKYRPEARIIGITRDPRDVACSIKARGLTFDDGVKRWIEDNTALLQRQDNENVIIVRLEDVVTYPKAELARIMDFLGIPHEDLLHYYEHPEEWYANEEVKQRPDTARGGNHEKLRNWQINQPIFSTTRRYDKDMSEADRKILSSYLPNMAPVAARLNYDLG